MTTHIILAGRQDLAVKTAMRWGWEPTTLKIAGRHAFIAPDGNAAVVSSSADNLRGIATDSIVYLAEAWEFAHGDKKAELRAHISHGGQVLLPDWKAGAIRGFVPPPYGI